MKANAVRLSDGGPFVGPLFRLPISLRHQGAQDFFENKAFRKKFQSSAATKCALAKGRQRPSDHYRLAAGRYAVGWLSTSHCA